jgi:hypothetical protein
LRSGSGYYGRAGAAWPDIYGARYLWHQDVISPSQLFALSLI